MRNRKRSARINPISAMDMDGLSSGSPPRIFWNSRKRPDKGRVGLVQAKPTNEKSEPMETDKKEELNRNAELSEKRKALFEPLSPTNHKRRISNEDLLPPPDFHDLDYPKGWLIGKKRKLVNVDVVESMRRIAVQEMNRKDGEIDVLSEQLEDDSRVLQHLQSQLVEEKRKRTEAERENQMLQDQVSVLTGMLEEHGPLDGEELPFEEDDLDGHDQDPPGLQ